MTVNELIMVLTKFPQDLRVAVEDADTEWCAPITGATLETHPSGEQFAVIKSCGYSEMLGRFS